MEYLTSKTQLVREISIFLSLGVFIKKYIIGRLKKLIYTPGYSHDLEKISHDLEWKKNASYKARHAWYA